MLEMLQQRLIHPSISPFSSPMHLINKKEKNWFFCVYYKALNQITIWDRFSIPTMDGLMDGFHGTSIFSKIDLIVGYHHIRVHKADVEKTTF